MLIYQNMQTKIKKCLHEGKKSRKPGNSMYAKFYFAKVPTMSVVHKTRTVQKLSQKNLLRDNTATSCHWEVFLMKWVWFFFRRVTLVKLKVFARFSVIDNLYCMRKPALRSFEYLALKIQNVDLIAGNFICFCSN